MARVATLLNADICRSEPERDNPDASLRHLTAALARGDDVAWGHFHREFGPGIFRQLLAATYGDHDLASEALQQTYLRIARHARPCHEEPMFRAWLKVVTRTALSDCRRRRSSFWQMLRRRSDDPSDTGSHAEPDGEHDRLQAALAEALARLDASDRDLLERKYFSGTDVRTLAERLGISAKAAESRLTRARAELRRHLLTLLARHD